MEIIIILLFVVVWIVLDPRIEEFLKQKNDRLIKTEQILGLNLGDKWIHDRYRRVKIIRYFIILIIFFDQTYLILFSTLFVCIIIYMGPFMILNRKAHIKIHQVRYHFPIYLRQIQVLLQNNTVVKSIELSLDYVPVVLYNDIKLLNDNLKLDPLNMQHYINCMKQYNLPEIQRSMKWLYRYQNFGYQDAYHQFNRMLISTSKWLRKSRIEKKNESIQVYQWMGMLPLVGVTFVFISAMMSVVISLFERG